MSVTITVPATRGATIDITGEERGPFLVHQSKRPIDVDLDEYLPWFVTHRKSGSRFPCAFLTKEAAESFADDVSSLMDWDTANTVMRDEIDHRTRWTVGAPTPEQAAAICRCMKARGGFR